MLVDTHCHLHDTEFYPHNREEAYAESAEAGVAMVCAGTDARSSREAVEFCATHPLTWPVIGIHPHEAAAGNVTDIEALLQSTIHDPAAPIGIGEIGLDYYYNHSPKNRQIELLEAQIQLALNHNLPISFHVREAYHDFWPIFDNFAGVRGVLHSFTDTAKNAEQGMSRGLFIGLNGISTFTKDPAQRDFFTSVPLKNIVLETDAPYLTPSPFRGKMNIPAYVGSVAEFHARARTMPLETFVSATTANAEVLFGVKFRERCAEYASSTHSQRSAGSATS